MRGAHQRLTHQRLVAAIRGVIIDHDGAECGSTSRAHGLRCLMPFDDVRGHHRVCEVLQHLFAC
jgi:hypothetical protein